MFVHFGMTTPHRPREPVQMAAATKPDVKKPEPTRTDTAAGAIKGYAPPLASIDTPMDCAPFPQTR